MAKTTALALVFILSACVAWDTPPQPPGLNPQDQHYQDAIDSGAPVYVHTVYGSRPNSAGGVDMSVIVENLSDKVIKYVYVGVAPYNAVGDLAPSAIGGKTLTRLEVVGPGRPGDRMGHGIRWNNVWYNSTFHCSSIKSVEAVFVDGETFFAEGSNLAKVVRPKHYRDCQL